MATATKAAPRKRAAKRAPSPAKSRLRFRTGKIGDKDIHWYEVDGKRGKDNPARQRGVTTILSNALPGPPLQWAANMAADCALDQRDVWERRLTESGRADAYDFIRTAHDRSRDAAAGRGTDVHKLAERLMNGEDVEVPEELADHVDQFIAWWQTWEPTVYATELVGANFTHNFFGKFDMLLGIKGWFPDDAQREAVILVDIKTGEKGPYEKDALQLLAYSNFEEVGNPDKDGWVVGEAGEGMDPMPAVDGCAVLKITGSTNELYPVNPELETKLFATFLHASRIAQFLGNGWKQEDKGWSRDALLSPIAAPYEEF